MATRRIEDLFNLAESVPRIFNSRMLRSASIFAAAILLGAKSFAQENPQVRGIPFSEVIVDVTGKKVLPFDSRNAVDQRIRKAIVAACNEATKRLNAADSPVQKVVAIDLNRPSARQSDSFAPAHPPSGFPSTRAAPAIACSRPCR